MSSRNRQIFLVDIGAMLWAMWLSCNDVVFNKVAISSSMQVIFRGTHWTRTWANFQKKINQDVATYWLSSNRDNNNGDLRQAWMVVY
jgi:hypothetical protein